MLTEAIDTSTSMGRFMFNVMGSFAQLEREMIQERTLAGLAAARERGNVGGRRSVMTKELLAEGQAMIAAGSSVTAAAKHLKVGKTTLYNAIEAVKKEMGANDLDT